VSESLSKPQILKWVIAGIRVGALKSLLSVNLSQVRMRMHFENVFSISALGIAVCGGKSKFGF
jgi:hypothetical protein